MKQIFNPYLPLDEFIPDGEPHVFDGRVYIYGSHDKEAGRTYCMLDYVTYSAPINDLTNWRYEGVIYEAKNDPDYKNRPYMYAPDVVKGNDGCYYLYYSVSGDFGQGGYFGPISVAKANTPIGPFKFIGHVHYKDGKLMKDYVPFDPAVINDNGVIRLYFGTQYEYEEFDDDFFSNDEHIECEMGMFGKSREEILEYAKKDSCNGAIMLVLEDDMVTVKENPKHIIPYKVKGTPFEAHPFYEGSSIRKFNDTYYFIYSSRLNHELCYATSKYPDRDFTFRGTLVSNGDIGYNGRLAKDKLNMTGTTHGSIEYINGEYYVFYHRLTHKSDYSRQGCAEKLYMDNYGLFNQVEITSCGLNNGPLLAEGKYPAVICCNLTNGLMPHGSNKIFTDIFPNVTNEGNIRYIGEITNNTLIGFKYFKFDNNKKLNITYRSKGIGKLIISTDILFSKTSEVKINEEKEFKAVTINYDFNNDVLPLYIKYEGSNTIDILEIEF